MLEIRNKPYTTRCTPLPKKILYSITSFNKDYKLAKRKFTVRSKNRNLRLCIIENSIFIEELISRTIGNILTIDWKESKSFGFSSSALSFNQKVQIIQDIKGIDKEIVKKLTCLMNIRNKFAHVYSISSFEELITLSKNGKDIKNALKKWYTNEHPDDIEKEYRYYFYFLADDITTFLIELSMTHIREVGFQQGKQRGQRDFMNYLIEEVKELFNGEEIIKRALNKMD